MAKKAETKVVSKTVKATIKTSDLRGQSLEELAETLKAVRSDLAEARKMHAAGELVNPRVLMLFKKTIARTETVIAEKAQEIKRKED